MIVMREIEQGRYRSECGLTMMREDGVEESGRTYDGEWVLRDSDGNILMIHNYRYDVASRMKIDLVHTR